MSTFKTNKAIQKTANYVKITDCKDNFLYGNCAVCAIGGLFNLSDLALRVILRMLRIPYDEDEGLSFSECTRVINTIAKNTRYKVIYKSNIGRLTYSQLNIISTKGKFLVMFDNHLSYMENGIIYDTYIKEDEPKLLLTCPTGWWQIT